MSSFNCKGIVLSSSDFKEKDKLLTVLTSDKGVIRVCVKGSAKQGSRNAAFTIPYILCDMVITVSHGFYYLKEASIIENNSDILNHLSTLVTAAHIADCLIDLSFDTFENVHKYYELAVYAYYALAQRPDDYLLIYSAFNWRLLTYAGHTIIYDNMDIESSINYDISLSDGSLHKGSGNLTGTEVTALNHFSTCDIKKLFTGKGSEKVLNDLKDFTTAYMSFQFDKEYKALDILDKKI